MPMERVDRPGESQEATEGKKMLGDLRVVCGFGVGSIPSTPPSKVPFKGLEGVLEGRGELEAPFKHPASPCPLSPPSSSLHATFKGPLKLPSAPFKLPSSPFVPPSSPLQASFTLKPPLKPPGKLRACRRSGFRTDESLHLQSGTQTQSHPTRWSSGRTNHWKSKIGTEGL